MLLSAPAFLCIYFKKSGGKKMHSIVGICIKLFSLKELFFGCSLFLGKSPIWGQNIPIA